MARRSAQFGDSQMTCTLPCNLRKSHLAIARGSFTPAEDLLSVDRQVRQQHCQLDVLGGSERVFSKKDNNNRLLYALHWMNMMFKSRILSSVFSVAPPLLCILADHPVFLIASIRMHPTQRECAPALDGGCLTTMLSLPLGYWYNIPAILLHNWNSHIPSWQRKPSPSLQRFGNTETSLLEMSFSLQTPSCRQRHDRGDSQFPVVRTMGNVCTIAHDPLQNSNLVRAEGLQLKPGRWLQQNGAKASWTLDQLWELHEFQGLPFAISLASLREFFPELVDH